MAARGALAGALAAATAAILVTGCATSVTGVPQAATTLPTAPTTTTSSPSTSTTTLSPACDPCTPPTTGSPQTSTSQTASSSIRPMPPLSSTDITSSVRTGTSTSASSSRTNTSTTTTSGDDDPGVIAGIHLASVLADLESSHVAGIDSSADLDKLRSTVDRARSKGLQMSVVSIGKKISNADTSAISSELFAVLGGTLLVLSPSLVSARTDQLTNSQRHKALKAAADAKGDEKAVTKFIDSALASTGAGGGTASATTPKTPKTPKTPTTAPSKHTKVGGVDITAVVSALGSDHIAIARGLDIKASEISGPVKRAWKNDLKLYVVILAKDPSVQVYEVAGAVIDKTGGTAIVVSPKRFSNASKTISSKELNKAVDAAKGATTYHDLVSEMVDSLLG